MITHDHANKANEGEEQQQGLPHALGHPVARVRQRHVH